MIHWIMTTRIGDGARAQCEAAWPLILDALADGAAVAPTLASHGISAKTLAQWRLENPGTQAQWDMAREKSADALFDEALAVARDPFVTVTDDKGKPHIVRRDSSHARTYIDTLKWAARIRNPRLYSDKTQIDMNVRTVDLTRIISDANARLAAAQAARVLDGSARRLDDVPTLADMLGSEGEG